MSKKKKNDNSTVSKEKALTNSNVNTTLLVEENEQIQETEEERKLVSQEENGNVSEEEMSKVSEEQPTLKVETKSTTSKPSSKKKAKKTSNEEKLCNVSGKEEEIEDKVQVESTSNEESEPLFSAVVEKKSHKTFVIVSIALLVIVFLLLLFSTIFGFMVSKHTFIISGTSIKNIDVSGLTKEQALEKVSTALNQKLMQPITLKHNEYEITVFPEQFGVSFATEDCINLAYSKGRTRKYFSK